MNPSDKLLINIILSENPQAKIVGWLGRLTDKVG